jgi:hypothetical protein
MLSEPTGCTSSNGRCTSFDHRAPAWHSQVLAQWPVNSSAAVQAAMMNWTQSTYAALLPFSPGPTSYQNYMDASLSLEQWPAQYFPAHGTYEFLQVVQVIWSSSHLWPNLNLPAWQ